MSDINVFYTQQTQTTANPVGGNKGGQPASGVNFFDMIFARLAEGQTEQALFTAPTAKPVSVPADDNLVTTDVSDDLMALIASAIQLSPEADAELDANATPIDPAQPAGLTNIILDPAGAKKLQATLDTLLEGLPADQRPVAMNISGDQLKAAMKKLGINAADIQKNSQSLIATGLTPEDLTKLVQLIDQGNDGTEIDPSIQAMLVGTIKIVPDGETTETIFLPKALIFGKNGSGKANGEIKEEEISTSVTALSLTVPVASAPTPAPGTEIPAEGTQTIRDARLADSLELLEQSQAEAAKTRGGAALGAHEAANENTASVGKPGPSNSTIAANFAGLLGSFMDNNAANGAFPEGMDWAQNDTSLSNAQVSSTTQLTSLVTQARDATQPHPATQYVAATLAKGAKDGETKNMTLRMDPPDLGKIEIHMHFTKDKSVKTHMVFEKPETMLMMQRDSQILERSLQESGLDAGGNNLSFELASDDHNFDNTRDHGKGEYGNGGRAGADDVETIETTMSWTVDHNTGLQHYNILA